MGLFAEFAMVSGRVRLNMGLRASITLVGLPGLIGRDNQSCRYHIGLDISIANPNGHFLRKKRGILYPGQTVLIAEDTSRGQSFRSESSERMAQRLIQVCSK
jgi:hypothetical protein